MYRFFYTLIYNLKYQNLKFHLGGPADHVFAFKNYVAAVGLSVASPRSFLAVGFPLQSLPQIGASSGKLQRTRSALKNPFQNLHTFLGFGSKLQRHHTHKNKDKRN